MIIGEYFDNVYSYVLESPEEANKFVDTFGYQY
jgi:hypothetical protein